MEQRLKDLLSDLGRRTLRGVKPCPKCGTYNGTRGFSCKNKSCDVVFKVADERKKKTTEACRIITNNQDVQVFCSFCKCITSVYLTTGLSFFVFRFIRTRTRATGIFGFYSACFLISSISTYNWRIFSLKIPLAIWFYFCPILFYSCYFIRIVLFARV